MTTMSGRNQDNAWHEVSGIQPSIPKASLWFLIQSPHRVPCLVERHAEFQVVFVFVVSQYPAGHSMHWREDESVLFGKKHQYPVCNITLVPPAAQSATEGHV